MNAGRRLLQTTIFELLLLVSLSKRASAFDARLILFLADLQAEGRAKQLIDALGKAILVEVTTRGVFIRSVAIKRL